MHSMQRASICLAIAIVGCTETGKSQAPIEGLSIVTADPIGGLSGSWAEGDLVVHFQTLADPEGPGVSARWTDADGYTIAVDFSGDPWAYELWSHDAPPLDAIRNREPLLDLVVRGSDALATVELDERAAQHAVFVQGLAAAIPPRDQRRLVATAEELERDAPGDGITQYNTGYYKQYFRVIDSGIFGAHQCTSWSNYYLDSNGYWYYYNYFLNRNGHGDSPSCDTVTCGAWNTKRGYKHPYKCNTPYAFCSTIWNRHNCRSDSKWQQNWVMRDAWCDQYSGICYWPQGLFNGAACNASTSCSSGPNACT